MPGLEDQSTFRIAVLPGDGIGVEVTAEAVRVLEALAPWSGVKLILEEHPAGAGEYLERGDPLPRETFDACLKAHAILLGAMGLPDVRWPDGREMTPQIDLRERLDLYAGLRPIRLLHEADTPLRRRKAGEIDMLIVRESTEGLFSARSSRRDPAGAEARDVMRITRRGADRVFRAAFREAEKRRRHVTLVDKANVLPSMVFFRSIFNEVAREFPGVRTDRVYVDAAALHLVRSPERFDVIVTENMFGDILSDLGAALIGGMGMAPSADVGNGRAVFQPSHGTAPDIAGKGIANPIAAILSAAMMLDWLGGQRGDRKLSEAASALENAVRAVFADGALKPFELGGSAGTRDITRAVLERISSE
jgi:3-isopropylmalate dehydrogenase